MSLLCAVRSCSPSCVAPPKGPVWARKKTLFIVTVVLSNVLLRTLCDRAHVMNTSMLRGKCLKVFFYEQSQFNNILCWNLWYSQVWGQDFTANLYGFKNKDWFNHYAYYLVGHSEKIIFTCQYSLQSKASIRQILHSISVSELGGAFSDLNMPYHHTCNVHITLQHSWTNTSMNSTLLKQSKPQLKQPKLCLQLLRQFTATCHKWVHDLRAPEPWSVSIDKPVDYSVLLVSMCLLYPLRMYPWHY